MLMTTLPMDELLDTLLFTADANLPSSYKPRPLLKAENMRPLG
jgi:hypothetical protein